MLDLCDLVRPRIDENPFTSRLAFDVWADDVLKVMIDEAAMRSFTYRVKLVRSLYAMDRDPLQAINDCFGVVNIAASVAEQANQVVGKPPAEPAVKVTKIKMSRVRVWLKKFWDTEQTRFANALLIAGIVSLAGLFWKFLLN